MSTTSPSCTGTDEYDSNDKEIEVQSLQKFPILIWEGKFTLLYGGQRNPMTFQAVLLPPSCEVARKNVCWNVFPEGGKVFITYFSRPPGMREGGVPAEVELKKSILKCISSHLHLRPSHMRNSLLHLIPRQNLCYLPSSIDAAISPPELRALWPSGARVA